MRRTLPNSMLSVFFFLCAQSVLGIDLPIRTLVLEGDAAPGVGDGVVFVSPDAPDVNSQGRISFFGTVAGPGISSSNNSGIWSDESGVLSLVAQEGMAAPGALNNETLRSPFNPTLSDSGRSSFMAQLSGGFFDLGFWGGDSNELVKIALDRTPAEIPGLDANVLQLGASGSSLIAGPVLNRAGIAGFFATLNGPGVQGQGISVLKVSSGIVTIVARQGVHAPGTSPESVRFTRFGSNELSINPVINDHNEMAFYGDLNSSSLNGGIWKEVGEELQLVVHGGMPAPGMEPGLNFTDFGDPLINNAGETAFVGTVTGGQKGIWAESDKGLRVVARQNTQAAGLPDGVLYLHLNDPCINSYGSVSFSGTLTGPGVTAENDFAFWSENSGELMLVMREGEPVPGMAPDVVFSSFWGAMNASRLVAVVAQLRGPGITGSNAFSIWAMNAAGELISVLKAGDTIEIEPEDVRVVRSAQAALFGGGGEDGFPNALTPAGKIGVDVQFTDDTDGIFLITLNTRGDLYGDGATDMIDLPFLVSLLLGEECSGCVAEQGDLNWDEMVDGRDLQFFVDLLLP